MIPLLLALAATPTAPSTSTPPTLEIAQSSPVAQAVDVMDTLELTEEQKAIPRSYPYGSLQLGVGFANDLKGTFQNVDPFDIRTNLNLNPGFNGEAAIGYKFNDFRTDLSVGYGNFGVDRQTFQVDGDRASVKGNGSVDIWTVMVNAYYDIPIRNSDNSLSRWSPYIGGGIGYANLSTPSCSFNDCFSGGSSSHFAWQAKLGVAYRVTDHGSAFLEGGYLGTVGGYTVDDVRFDNFGTWRVNLGWRQRFGGPAKSKSADLVQEDVITSPEPQPEPLRQSYPESPMPVRGLW
jgi:opacity protein-like surface antigen